MNYGFVITPDTAGYRAGSESVSRTVKRGGYRVIPVHAKKATKCDAVKKASYSETTDMNMEGKTYYSRFQIKETSPTSNAFSEAMSEDGKTWKASFEGKETKK